MLGLADWSVTNLSYDVLTYCTVMSRLMVLVVNSIY